MSLKPETMALVRRDEQIAALERENAALRKALEAEEAYAKYRFHGPYVMITTPFGHECMWCSTCVDRLTQLRRAALAASPAATCVPHKEKE